MMMNKKTLLESGMLEQYVLGELNPKIHKQIENLLTSDAELKTYYDALEKDFETIGIENAITPPAHIKSKVMDYAKNSKPKVIHLNNTNYKLYMAISASIATVFIVSSFWMYTQLSTMKQQIQTAETNNTTLKTNIETLNKELKDTYSLYETIVNPDTKQYILNNDNLSPKAKVISYVNHNTKSVVINTERLPDLDDKHDYQMWADVEGEMISMGVISKSKNLLAMHYIDHAESLNITIEPAGGNNHATVANLVTNVYLS